MALHLIKLAVGIDSVDRLGAVQTARRAGATGRRRLRMLTRNVPRRAAEILDGGSIYWVIRGKVRVRQRILAIERVADAEGGTRCAVGLDPALVAVEPRPSRPFQGWRYLEAADAPPDLPASRGGEPEMPSELVAELKELGLL